MADIVSCHADVACEPGALTAFDVVVDEAKFGVSDEATGKDAGGVSLDFLGRDPQASDGH